MLMMVRYEQQGRESERALLHADVLNVN